MIVGIAVGSAFTYNGIGHANATGTQVRAVRSPCNLAPPGLVGRLLPHAAISSEDRYLNPGEKGFAQASCSFQEVGEATHLDLDVRRSGPKIVYKSKGKKETEPAAQIAQEDFERSVTGLRQKCSMSPVKAGEQAFACRAGDTDAVKYLVLARKADLVVTISEEPAIPGQEDLFRQIALAVLGSA
ncbi:hypothetical protein ACQPZP_18035 [Spirillospora sp. CA-142024]|uniref:hypothetical protein n=1 Tax=Spirillospora sp. CA-142024 TaxID=3240036 RepID=UPI003D9002C1